MWPQTVNSTQCHDAQERARIGDSQSPRQKFCEQQRLKHVPVFMYSHAPQALRLRRQGLRRLQNSSGGTKKNCIY
jgi:hypothetical protein